MDLISKLQKYWKPDLNAGFSLFLIALPLSIGIAMASGAPPSAGIISAIVGGILGSLLGGGHININGPAAGLIVIVLSSIQLLGHGDPALGFKYTLAAITVAGALQIFFGLLGLARLGLAFPSSVIHGMLTAIGVIILVKQIFVGAGVTPHSKTVFDLILEIPKSLQNINVGISFIALATLIAFLGFQKIQNQTLFRKLRFLPAPVVAVCTGVLLSKYLESHTSLLTNAGNYLLRVPDNLFAGLARPDFSIISSYDSIKMIITLTLVASLESTLSSFAVDKLDPLKRSSNLNRDLWSKGVCNIICGFFGGLPIITEIVRSSANISSGAKSIFANFFHGIFILAFIVCCPWMLNEIPLSSLAALLVVVGWRLAHPSNFKHAFEIGPDHTVAFMATLITTLAVDLLAGIVVGLIVELTFALIMGVKVKNLFKANIQTVRSDDKVIIKSHSPLLFSNSLTLRNQVSEFANTSKNITVDLTKSDFIDHTVMDCIDSMQNSFQEFGGEFKVITSPRHRTLSNHSSSSRWIYEPEVEL
ncbi:MAG: SulP family inorganic anion transporter [Bdellovibrio sp.]